MMMISSPLFLHLSFVITVVAIIIDPLLNFNRIIISPINLVVDFIRFGEVIVSLKVV